VRGNISRRIVQLHKEFYGKGPTQAKTYYVPTALLPDVVRIEPPTCGTKAGQSSPSGQLRSTAGLACPRDKERGAKKSPRVSCEPHRLDAVPRSSVRTSSPSIPRLRGEGARPLSPSSAL
jgi:hypothetical protein